MLSPVHLTEADRKIADLQAMRRELADLVERCGRGQGLRMKSLRKLSSLLGACSRWKRVIFRALVWLIIVIYRTYSTKSLLQTILIAF
jgi:hypothetical protein